MNATDWFLSDQGVAIHRSFGDCVAKLSRPFGTANLYMEFSGHSININIADDALIMEEDGDLLIGHSCETVNFENRFALNLPNEDWEVES